MKNISQSSYSDNFIYIYILSYNDNIYLDENIDISKSI